ncbi:MAG: NfeD family protein [Hydrogenibacillus sp.]|nr:NfeD family protein [Hydrogenibacillus sp.]
MQHFLALFTQPLFWFGLGFALLIVEVLTVTFILLWIGLGALAAGITALITPNPEIPLIVFITVSVILWIFTRPLTRRARRASARLESGVYALIGKNGLARTALDDSARGEVQIGGEIWAAKSEGGRIAAGSTVRIVRVEGVTLIVEPADRAVKTSAAE